MQRRRQVIWIGVFDDVDVLTKKFSHRGNITRLVAELFVGNIFNLHPVIHLVPV